MRVAPSLAGSLLVLTSACGGTGDTGASASSPSSSPSPTAAASVEGVYGGSLATESTNFEGESVSPASPTEYAFTCADPSCSEVFQRTDTVDPRSVLSSTYRFTVAGDTWTSVKTAEGACASIVAPPEGSPPPEGDYSQRITWSWTRADDGAMTGEILQVFTGCELNGEARYSATAEATPKGDLPYLDAAPATTLKQALTSYDEVHTQAVEGAQRCATEDESDAARGADCWESVLGAWGSGVTELATSLGTVSDEPSAGAACRTALEKVGDLGPLREALQAAEAAYAATENATSAEEYDPALEALDEALTIYNGSAQREIAFMPTQCLAPDDLAGLGEQGELAIDVDDKILAQ